MQVTKWFDNRRNRAKNRGRQAHLRGRPARRMRSAGGGKALNAKRKASEDWDESTGESGSCFLVDSVLV